MAIYSIEVYNFRNLDNLKIKFNEDLNIIIGDHDVGKTNILHLLDKIANLNFENCDFLDKNKDILVKIVTYDKQVIDVRVTPGLKITRNGELVSKSVYIPSSGYRNYQNSSLNPALSFGLNCLKKKINSEHMDVILLLDEPENHLNPYKERALINHYINIINGSDKMTLNKLNLKSIKGQIFIATHSSDTLIADFKNLIRLYKEDKKVKYVSGSELEMDEVSLKHALIMFKEIKEAFFAKKALIVEGISEYAAFEGFAASLNYSYDDEGVCLINGLGEGSLKYLKNLLEAFKIPSYLVYDNDVKHKYENEENVFFTKEATFEKEIVDSLVNNMRLDILREIASQLPYYDNYYVTSSNVNKIIGKFMKVNYFKGDKLKNIGLDHLYVREIFFAYFYLNKGIFLGRNIGKLLTENEIPMSYKEALRAVFNK